MAATQFANANSAGTTLNNGGNMLAGDVSCTVTSAATLASPTVPQFMILIDSELILVGAVAGNVFSALVRGQEGTAAAGHNNGAAVFCPPTAGMLTTAFLRADAVNTVEVTGTDFKPSGLAGSTAASRFIGATATGFPVSGTQAVGDLIADQTGRVWVTTAAGTPGSGKSTAAQELANTFTQDQTFGARVVFNAAASKQIPGATSHSLRNRADTADNLLVTDAGLATMRNALEVPYAAAAALPTHSYGTVPVKIDDQLLGVAAATITFVNPLPTGFRHLLIEWYARGDTAATFVGMSVRFNNVSTATYDGEVMRANNVTASALVITAATGIQLGLIPAATATANYFAAGQARVNHYQSLVGNKLVTAQNYAQWSDVAADSFFDHSGGKWRTVGTAITRLDIFLAAGNFLAGSLFTLWGIP